MLNGLLENYSASGNVHHCYGSIVVLSRYLECEREEFLTWPAMNFVKVWELLEKSGYTNSIFFVKLELQDDFHKVFNSGASDYVSIVRTETVIHK